MTDNDLHSYEMILRVRDYGVQQASSFPASTRGAELFAVIDQAATTLASHVAKQSAGAGSAREGTATKAVAREGLRNWLERIRRTARSMSQTTAGLDSKFRIPRNMTDQALLGTAQAFHDEATPLKDEFIKYAMPATFLEDLAGQIRFSGSNFEPKYRDATSGDGDRRD